MNPNKCKIMKISKWNETGGIIIGGNEIETVDAFCYLGSTLTDDSSCNKEIRARIGKGSFRLYSTNFSELFHLTISEYYKIWRNCCPNTFVEEYKILA